MSASKGERVVISAKYPQTPPCKTNTHDTIENIQIYNRNIIQQMNIYTLCTQYQYPTLPFTEFHNFHKEEIIKIFNQTISFFSIC